VILCLLALCCADCPCDGYRRHHTLKAKAKVRETQTSHLGQSFDYNSSQTFWSNRTRTDTGSSDLEEDGSTPPPAKNYKFSDNVPFENRGVPDVGTKEGTFWKFRGSAFWKIMTKIKGEGAAPSIISEKSSGVGNVLVMDKSNFAAPKGGARFVIVPLSKVAHPLDAANIQAAANQLYQAFNGPLLGQVALQQKEPSMRAFPSVLAEFQNAKPRAPLSWKNLYKKQGHTEDSPSYYEYSMQKGSFVKEALAAIDGKKAFDKDFCLVVQIGYSEENTEYKGVQRGTVQFREYEGSEEAERFVVETESFWLGHGWYWLAPSTRLGMGDTLWAA